MSLSLRPSRGPAIVQHLVGCSDGTWGRHFQQLWWGSGPTIEVEAHLSAGLPGLSLVGCRIRTQRGKRSCASSCRQQWVELAELPNDGQSQPRLAAEARIGTDVSIAVAILAADGRYRPTMPRRSWRWVAGLDGRIRPAIGALATALALRRATASS